MNVEMAEPAQRVYLEYVPIIVCLITVWIADDIQQRRFQDVSYAYSQMEAGYYAEAGDGFEKYLSAHSEQSLYWTLIEKINGADSRYTYKNVQITLSECKDRLLSNYFTIDLRESKEKK